MPELPEVETVRRGLIPVLVGRRLARVTARRPNLRFPLPAAFAARLTGRTVDAIERRAKYLLFRCSGGLTMIGHLGMSGSFRIPEAGDVPPLHIHDHLVFETDGGGSVRFHDPRRFGFVDLVDTNQTAAHPMLAPLGPEPLEDGFDAAFIAARCRDRRAPVKSLLLDQRVVAGMGNIYACESLFRAALSPAREASSITGQHASRLVEAIRDVLREAIEAGGSSLRDHVHPSGELGCFQHRFAVYGRKGERCPGCTCDGGIVRVVQSGRSTFFCPQRQR